MNFNCRSDNRLRQFINLRIQLSVHPLRPLCLCGEYQFSLNSTPETPLNLSYIRKAAGREPIPAVNHKHRAVDEARRIRAEKDGSLLYIFNETEAPERDVFS